MKAGIHHSITFPPAQESAARQPNVLATFASALADVELVRKKLRDLLVADDRHGDLQVVLSAVHRVQDAVQALIRAEEEG